MNDNVYRIVEVVGTSAESTDAAVKNAIARAGKTLHNLDWFEMVGVRGHLKDGAIAHYQVTLKVGFRLDE